jgi:hypothetical protein
MRSPPMPFPSRVRAIHTKRGISLQARFQIVGSGARAMASVRGPLRVVGKQATDKTDLIHDEETEADADQAGGDA